MKGRINFLFYNFGHNQMNVYLIIGATVIFIVAVMVVLFIFLGKTKKCILSDTRLKTRRDVMDVGITPLDCTLFQAIYLPWVPIPSFSRSVYQPEAADFLFRLCWNITTTNCWKHRFDFDPPKVFDTVKRISNSLGRMYAYWLHSSTLRLGILCFTGTAFADDWARNLLFAQMPPATLKGYKLGVRAHVGFYSIYAEVQEEINDILKTYKDCTDKFVLSGYSLGGALAVTAALDLYEYNPVMYSFGGPRVFNDLGANLVNQYVPNHWRIFNTEDIISDLPPSVAGENPIVDPFGPGTWIYSHCGKVKCWTHSMGTLLDNHSRAYELFLLSKSKPF